MTEPITVSVVTGARSEYGLMRWPMQVIADDPRFVLTTVVTGSHLSEAYGGTYREIEADGFHIDAKVPVTLGSGSDADLVRAVGEMTSGFADVFAATYPDLVLVMGDRYELLALCAACVLMTIPIAHVSGGEITEGAIDEQIRHAVTKMAHLHFVANETYAARVRQMGEEGWRICVSGEPGLDNLRRLPLLTKGELERVLELDLSGPTALVTYHPVTLNKDSKRTELGALIAAMEEADLQYVLTYPSADPDSEAIINALTVFRDRHPRRAVLFKNLGQKRYLSTLQNVTMMIGNSSSGLFEAPAFNLPVVNVGDRQKGRMRATNVIDVAGDKASILRGIEAALAYDRSVGCGNPYGDGRSSERIRDFIADTFAHRTRDQILRKRFADIPT